MIEFTWHGRPGDAKVNHRFVPTLRGGRPVLVKSRTYRDAVKSMADAFKHPKRFDGPVCVSVQVHVWRAHRQGVAQGLAYLDVDACCKAVLDALQSDGCPLDDDAQVKGLQIVKHRAEAKHMERIEVQIDDAPVGSARKGASEYDPTERDEVDCIVGP